MAIIVRLILPEPKPYMDIDIKMANALLTLNETSRGRAMIGISGGGGVPGAMGWRVTPDAPVWPRKDPATGARYPERRVRGLRECIDVLRAAASGELNWSCDGQIFQITRPFHMNWAQAEKPLVYGCCTGPQMLRAGARLADGIQLSDYPLALMADAMAGVTEGLQRREKPAKDFRIGNFWAWHIKQDREVSMYEARRELIWRGAIAAKYAHEIRPYCHDEDEVQLVIDNWDNLFKAFWTRSGKIEGLPADLVNRLIGGLSSAGNLDDLDRERERIQAFADSGLTELALRLFDEPMQGLELIGQHVLPILKH